MDLENTVLRGRSQPQKATQYIISLTRIVQNRQIHRDVKYISVARG